MKKHLLLLTFLFLMTACLQDKTVTEFGNVELPVLDNPEGKPEWLSTRVPYFMKVGDVLEIDANISYSNPDALTYQWVIDGKTIEEDKDNGTYRNHLKWTCDLKNDAVGALYVMIPAEKAGKPIATVFKFFIRLDHPFERGIMVATAQQEKVVYSFLQENVGKPFVEHPAAYEAGTPVSSWVKEFEFWSNESSSVIGNRFHLDRNPANSCTIEPGLVMTSKVQLTQEFMNVPAGLELIDAHFAGYVGYLVDKDHHVYSRKSQKGYYTGRYSDRPLEYKGEVLEISTFAESPYRSGVVIAYDSKNERFLTINNAYDDMTNKKAGIINEIPEGVELNHFAGEDIKYMQVIAPDWVGEPFLLVVISCNRATGEYSFSEYSVEFADGKIIDASRRYYKEKVEGFGENSVFTILDSPMNGGGMIYYTDNSDAMTLRYISRQSTGMGGAGIFHKFPSEVVSLDHSKIGRRYKFFTAGFKDRSLRVFDLTVSMTEYIAPTEEERNSLMHEWEDVGGDILQVIYCYGNISAY